MAQTRFSQWVQTLTDASQSLLSKYVGQKKLSLEERCRELLTSKGEALGTALAADLVRDYRYLDDEGKLDFFNLLHREFTLDVDGLLESAQTYKNSGDQKSYTSLIASMESPRKKLFGRINMAPQGTETLVRMRSDLLALFAMSNKVLF